LSSAAARPLATTYRVTPFGLTRRVDSFYKWNKQSHPHYTTTILVSNIRGGNMETPSTPTANTLLERVGPYWSSFSKLVQEKTKLVQEKVEPALKDPRSNIWDPLKQFVESQKQVAKERQVMVKEDPKQAAVLLVNPARFVKIGIAAWIVAELLHQMGFFDNTAGVGPKLRKLYKEHASGHVSEVQYRLQDWWDEERSHGGWLNLQTYRQRSILSRKIRNMAPRYQFAIGGGLGMIVSPVVWILAIKTTKCFIVTYLLSEINEYWRDCSSVGESAVELIGFRGKGGDRINDFLDEVRELVRSTVVYPEKFWADTRKFMSEDDEDGVSANTKQGLLVGTIIGIIV